MNIKTAQAVGKAQLAVKNIGNAFKGGDLQTGISSITDAHQPVTKLNPIEFHNYNYPPLIRLYHYPKNGVGVKEPAKSLIKKMCLAANLIIYLSMMNLVNNIIQMSSNCPLIKGKQVAFSVFSKCHLVLFD